MRSKGREKEGKAEEKKKTITSEERDREKSEGKRRKINMCKS